MPVDLVTGSNVQHRLVSMIFKFSSGFVNKAITKRLYNLIIYVGIIYYFK